MLVFKVKKEDGSYIEINFCEGGLYFEIGDIDRGMESNFVMNDSEVGDLISYLNEN
jgi:hypothetical protein